MVEIKGCTAPQVKVYAVAVAVHIPGLRVCAGTVGLSDHHNLHLHVQLSCCATQDKSYESLLRFAKSSSVSTLRRKLLLQ